MEENENEEIDIEVLYKAKSYELKINKSTTLEHIYLEVINI